MCIYTHIMYIYIQMTLIGKETNRKYNLTEKQNKHININSIQN